MRGGEYLNWIDSLPANVRKAVLVNGQMRHFNAGYMLYARTAPPTGVFRVDKGRVRLFLLKDTGSEFLLKICEEGETIGDLGAMDGLPYAAFAEAMTDVTATFIPIKAINSLRKTYPEIDSALLGQVVSSARGVIGLLERITMHSMEKQVAGRLQWLLRSERLRGNTGNSIQISQGDLALMLGASRQTVNKALSKLEEDGFVTRKYGEISVVDENRLEKYLALEPR